MNTSGILLADKSEGITSHDVINLLRNKLRIKKIGHAGTLDPMATGLLIILIAKATKSAGQFADMDKIYEVKLTLGIKTNTADSTGIITQKKEVNISSLDIIEKIMYGFIGDITQIPPMFSAKKIKGKKLYRLARNGLEVERQPQKVSILGLTIKKIDIPHVYFVVNCSKGTYVRTLCEDIGERIGCGAHMSQLRRYSCGGYFVENALTISQISQMNVSEIEKHIISI